MKRSKDSVFLENCSEKENEEILRMDSRQERYRSRGREAKEEKYIYGRSEDSL